jgi:DNA-binding NarL/FixJ family response regulator
VARASTRARATRVLVVNDQELVRYGIRAIVDAQPGLEVAGEAADAREAVGKLADLRPDVVLIDVVTLDLDTVEAIRVLANPKIGDPVPVLVLMSSLGDHCVEVVRAGACGVFLKNAAPQELAAALLVAAAGYAVLAPSLTPSLIEELLGSHAVASPRSQRIVALSSRERDVLRLVAQGYSNAEIARSLHLGESTVKSHVQRMLSKLGLRDRLQAVIYSYEVGFVPRGGKMAFLDPPQSQTNSTGAPGTDPLSSVTLHPHFRRKTEEV